MQPTLIETDRLRRLKFVNSKSVAFTPTIKSRIIKALELGATLTEIARTPGLPHLSAIHAERKKDTDFDAAVREARIIGAEIKLDIVAENAEREAESRDPDRMRVAQMLAAVTTTYVEKIAPKEYGQLVKLGSDPNAPLAVHVIDYSALHGGSLNTQVDSGDDKIDAREVAAQAAYDANAAARGQITGQSAVCDDRPRPGRRRVGDDNRQKAPTKAPRKAS